MANEPYEKSGKLESPLEYEQGEKLDYIISPEGEVPVMQNDGRVKLLPEAKARELLGAGTVMPATLDQLDKEREKQHYESRGPETAAQHFLNTSTFGLADKIITKIDPTYREQRIKHTEENPIWGAGGSAAAFFTPGFGILGKAGGTIAKKAAAALLEKAGQKVATAAGKASAKTGITAYGMGATGAEFAGFAVGQEAERATIYGKKFDPANIAKDLVLGAAFGAGFSLVGKVVGWAAKKGLKKELSYVEALRGKKASQKDYDAVLKDANKTEADLADIRRILGSSDDELRTFSAQREATLVEQEQIMDRVNHLKSVLESPAQMRPLTEVEAATLNGQRKFILRDIEELNKSISSGRLRGNDLRTARWRMNELQKDLEVVEGKLSRGNVPKEGDIDAETILQAQRDILAGETRIRQLDSFVKNLDDAHQFTRNYIKLMQEEADMCVENLRRVGGVLQEKGAVFNAAKEKLADINKNLALSWGQKFVQFGVGAAIGGGYYGDLEGTILGGLIAFALGGRGTRVFAAKIVDAMSRSGAGWEKVAKDINKHFIGHTAPRKVGKKVAGVVGLEILNERDFKESKNIIENIDVEDWHESVYEGFKTAGLDESTAIRLANKERISLELLKNNTHDRFAFSQTLSAVTDLKKLIYRAKEGLLTAKEIEVLKAKHPNLYKEMVRYIQYKLKNEDLDYRTKINLKRFAGEYDTNKTLLYQQIAYGSEEEEKSNKKMKGGTVARTVMESAGRNLTGG